MKKIVALIITVLLLVSLLTGCWAGAVNEAMQEIAEDIREESSDTFDEQTQESGSAQDDSYYKYESWYEKADRNSIVFDDITYTRPDADAIVADLKVAEEAMKAAADQDQRDNVYMRALDMLFDYETLINYTYIRSSQDQTDSYWKDEYAYLNSGHYGITDAVSDIDELYRDLSSDSEENDDLSEGEIAEDVPDDESSEILERYAELKDRETELISEYYSVMYSSTVEYNGRVVDISTAYYSGDLNDSEYVEAVDKYYGEKNPQAAGIYIELIGIRNELAEMNGYDTYEEYVYDMSGADYPYEDIVAYRDYVKKYFADDYIEATGYSLDELYTAGCTSDQVFGCIEQMCSDSDILKEAYDYMMAGGLYDIERSDKKSSSAFEMYLYSYDSPFIMVNSAGNIKDIYDVAHEFGHFCDDYVNWEAERVENECLDMSEVFSQTLSHLVLYNMDGITSESDEELLAIYSYIDDYQTFVEQTYYNELESILYETDDLTVDKVNDIAGRLAEEYGLTENAHDTWDDVSWIDISHLFEQPFYTISYCTSLDASLQIAEYAEEDYYGALDLYEWLLDRQGDGGFISNLERVGLVSPFGEERVKEVHDHLAYYLLEY